MLWRLLIATVDIDDHHALPDKELLKAAFNCLHGFAQFVGRIVRGDTHRRSTSPTLMSWRSKSSAKKVSSANAQASLSG